MKSKDTGFGAGTEPRQDPIAEAKRQWIRHGWSDAADGISIINNVDLTGLVDGDEIIVSVDYCRTTTPQGTLTTLFSFPDTPKHARTVTWTYPETP